MLFSVLLVVAAAAAATNAHPTVAAAAAAPAPTYYNFQNTITCPLFNGSTVSYTASEVEAIVLADATSGTALYDGDVASDVGTTFCQGVDQGLYYAHLDAADSDAYFAVDANTSEYWFCDAVTSQVIDITIGYPTQCTYS